MSVNMNFFQWLRDGVRQSVIMGVSDAVEQIGVPEEDQTVNPQIAALLAEPTGSTSSTKRKRVTSTANSRRRLGKSLQEMDEAAA